MPTSIPIVHITRGPITESVHRGHIAVVDASGHLIYELGDPQHVTYARSTAKLLQTVPLIESGAADQYGLTPAEIAVTCSSHNGEAEHVATVRSILNKLGLDESALLCGIHQPWHKQTRESMRAKQIAPNPLHSNCSGKHAGMLTLAAHIDSSLTAYTDVDHPVQSRILHTVCELAQIDQSDVHIGTDGCGVPVYGMSMTHLATAFARFGSGQLTPANRTDACKRIMQALINHPFLLAGSDRFDTELIKVTNGRVIGKMGAEGMYAITIPSAKLGIALKVDDGAGRAAVPAAIEILLQLDLISRLEMEQLASFYQPIITNRRNEQVGLVKPIFSLQKS